MSIGFDGSFMLVLGPSKVSPRFSDCDLYVKLYRQPDRNTTSDRMPSTLDPVPTSQNPAGKPIVFYR
jgi:hypothetical protein